MAAEFVNRSVYSTGATPQPYSVAAGDFNHDNRSDVVVANSGTDDLRILVGSVNGTFDKEMVYQLEADSHPQDVITCDINQDQRLDLVSVNSKLNTMTMMIGQSDGSFANQKMYFTGNNSHPSAVASGDLDNNGWLDLVTANEGTDSIGVFFGFDYSTFQSLEMYHSDDSLRPIGIVASDLNNDRSEDLAAAFSVSDKIGIYLGCGNGSFILTWIYSIGNGTAPLAIVVNDLNNDSQADIILSNSGTHEIGILLGYGNGNFASVKKYSSGGSKPSSVAVADMNNDNRLDVVVANFDSGNVVVLYGYGDGSFPTMKLYYFQQNSRSASITVCDLYNDGVLYVLILDAVLDPAGLPQTVRGSDVSPDPEISSTIMNGQPQRVAVADFNNDSRLDMAVAYFGWHHVRIHLSNGNATFVPEVRYFLESGLTPVSLDVGDFNNDNILDIVVVSFETNYILVLFGVGDGTFLPGKSAFNYQRIRTKGVATGDFNNDARLDIAVTNAIANNISVFLGGGNESIAGVNTYATGYTSQPHSVAVGDVNNDHLADIVVANYGTDNAGVLLGRSDRNFTSMNAYSTDSGSAPYSVAMADFNQDNYLDIAVTTSETNNIIIFLGDGDGTFMRNATYSTGRRSRPYTLVISDFNNGRIWDIAVANSGTSNIFLIYGSGSGAFGNEISYSFGYGYHPYSIAVIDLNGDEWMEHCRCML